MSRLILACSLENCVHVGGVINFLNLAEKKGYNTKFVGPAVSISKLLDAVAETDPEYIAVSYRLTPSTARNVLTRLKTEAEERDLAGYKYIFGGTEPVAEVAKDLDFFEMVFGGKTKIQETIAFLEGENFKARGSNSIKNLKDLLEARSPLPIIRHHYGQPDLTTTIAGIEKIAQAEVLDVISIGPDQNTQQFYFEPENIQEELTGAGGVPLRSAQDFRDLYEATRQGNYPLIRSYSGTQHLLKMAELLQDTIKNAWAAIPLTWYSVLDGRSERALQQAIKENQSAMSWHGRRGIPVEVNESHHWSLRDSSDTIAVAMAFLAAYNAKESGVKDYIAQYMFNNPAATSYRMDLAKMLAKQELIQRLADFDFNIITQVRAGLASFPADFERARAQLALSTWQGMALQPDIVHVVGYPEADHAARADEVIASCKLARHILEKAQYDYPDLINDKLVQARKNHLLSEVDYLLEKIADLSSQVRRPWADPGILTEAIKIGLIDAPHLKNNVTAAGLLKTKIVEGGCDAYDYKEDKVLTEIERINKLEEFHG
ncbi:MAG: methionine synthase [Bacillota bacterium]